jgi:hypothetical protein
VLTRPEVLRLLPYGEEFLLIDDAEQRDGRRVITSFAWAHDRAEIAAHFSAGPRIVPGALVAEQGAQSALLLAVLEGYHPARTPALLRQLRCDFEKPAFAPCTVTVEAAIGAVVENGIGFHAVCSVGEAVVARVRGAAALTHARHAAR